MNRKFNLANTVTMNSAVLPHFKKTDSIMYLSIMKPFREKMRKLHLFDSEENLFEAFTLAETLITLTILGVVAAITVPSLINKQMESANRTKVKKAMDVYEKALNQMIIDNDIKNYTGLTALNDATCSKTTEYFKKVETTASDCRFKTADRIWWDISNIENPIISLKDEIKTAANATTVKGNADSLDKDKTSFVMVGKIDDNLGILRVNDNAYTPGINDDKYLTKLWGFIVSVNNNVDDIKNDCDYTCRTNNISDDLATKWREGYYKDRVCASYSEKSSCIRTCTPGGICVYDENGNEILTLYGEDCSDTNVDACTISGNFTVYNENNRAIVQRSNCNKDNFPECEASTFWDYNEDGNNIEYKTGCNSLGEECSQKIYFIYAENDKVNYIQKVCNGDDTGCHCSRRNGSNIDCP